MPSRLTAATVIDRFATLANDPDFFTSTYTEIQTEDQTLLDMAGWRKYRLYKECEKDTHFCTTRDKLKRSILGREFGVVAADEDNEADTKVAEVVKERLAKINIGPEYPEYSGFDGITWYLLEGIFTGMQPAEVDWDGSTGQPVGFRALPPNRVGFWLDQATSLPELRVRMRNKPVDGVVPPARKILNFAYNATSNNPSGIGLCSDLWWCIFFKKNGGVLPWGEFNESFANPTPDVTYKQGADDDDKAACEEIVEKISARAGVAHSENVVVQFLEALRTGSFETYDRWIRYWDEQISARILGESATTNQSAGNGSRARDEVASAQQLATARGYVDLMHSYLESTLVRWIVDIEFSFDTPVPTLSRQWDDPEDLDSRAERDSKLDSIGWELTDEKFQQIYGEGYQRKPKPDPVDLSGKLPGLERKNSAQQFAVRQYTDQYELDDFVDSLPIDISKLAAPIQELASGAKSEEEFYLMIGEQFPQLATEQLEELLERAIFTAKIWGDINSGFNK